MSPIEKLVKEAARLPVQDRKRLIRRLQALLPKPAKRKTDRTKGAIPAEKAMRAFLSLKGHSDYTDVSADKGKHLAEVYAPKP